LFLEVDVGHAAETDGEVSGCVADAVDLSVYTRCRIELGRS